MEPIHCRVVPELHRHRRLVLQLRTNVKMVKNPLNLTSERFALFEHTFCFYNIYLFVGTGGHVSTQVEMSRRVDKHNLESIVELCQRWLQGKDKKKSMKS